jgi:hypothetical protein
MFAHIEYVEYSKMWMVWLESEAYRSGNVDGDAYWAGEWNRSDITPAELESWCVLRGWTLVSSRTEYRYNPSTRSYSIAQ